MREELWQRALARRERNIKRHGRVRPRTERVREYQRNYARRIRFELKIKRMRETFARVELLCEKLIAS